MSNFRPVAFRNMRIVHRALLMLLVFTALIFQPSRAFSQAATGTPTHTSTVTVTVTSSPTSSQSPSATSTNSQTPTASEIPPVSPSSSPTSTASAGVSTSSTPTVTASASANPPTETETQTPAPSESPTFSGSATATLTVTATPSPSASPSPTTSVTVTPTLESSSGEYKTDEVLVRFHTGVTQEQISQTANLVKASLGEEIELLDVIVFDIPAGLVSQVVSQLNSLDIVDFAEPNFRVEAIDILPSDSNWASQYGPAKIQAPQAWELTTGGSTIIVAIIDTGVDLNHPDLAGKIVAGYDFVNNDSIAQDDQGHGSHVAGIAAAVSNNGTGIAGISWGARIMPVKVLDSSGSGWTSDIAAGITWAADNGAKVINLSLGGPTGSTTMESAVDYATSQGVLVVAAAGNSGDSSPQFPASYANVLAVAATDSSNTRASFSSYGSFVDIAAPGVSIYSTIFDNGYSSMSGTSMAAPHVAGAAALLWNYSANLDSVAEVRTALESTALDLGTAGRDDFYGYGLVQLLNALQFDPANVTPSPTPTATPDPLTYYYIRSDSCPIGIPFQWVDASGGSSLSLGDDSSQVVTLPFAFSFNEQSNTQIYIGSNGLLSFEVTGSTNFTNVAIPNSSSPNIFISPYWDDLAPNISGNIYYTTVGTEPNRQFVVEWNAVPHYPSEGSLTFQAILFEGSNEIVFQYGAMSGSYANGNSATIGLEFASGSAGLLFAHNTNDSVFDGLAVRFVPGLAPECNPSPTETPTPTPTPTAEPVSTWYLAEGFTGAGFSTFILIQNPGSTNANVRLTYFVQGGSEIERNIVVSGNSRFTVVAADENQVGSDKAFSTRIDADQQIIVERAMYYGNGGHATSGITSPKDTWYLAEGYTGGGFETYILIQNPNSSSTNITLTYSVQGEGQVIRNHSVPGNSRYTIITGDSGQVGKDKAFSTKISSDQPVIVERSMYYPNGAHASAGVSGASTTWYLAEGFTGANFGTFILIQNPNGTVANVTVAYSIQGGGQENRNLTVAANSRYTIVSADASQVGVDQAFSTKITSDQPVIVERSMYYANGALGSTGITSPNTRWYLAEGYTGPGFSTFILVQNPNSSSANLTVSYLLQSGGVINRNIQVAGNSRFTINAGDAGQAGSNQAFSTLVQSDISIIVERAMYFAEGAHNAPGITIP